MSIADRPIVRVAIVWLAMVLIWLFLGQFRSLFWGTGYTLGGHIVSAILASALAIPVVIAARCYLDRKSVTSLGLDLNTDAIKQFFIGATAFLVPSALGFALALTMGWSSIVPAVSWGEIFAFIPLLILLVFIYEALPEELAFRGYIQTNFAMTQGYWGAIFGQAVLFALWGAALWSMTAGGIALDRFAMFFFMALVLGMIRGATGSVWTTIGFHVAFQTVAQLLLNTERGHFAIEGADTMQLVALGIVPFSLAVLIVETLAGRPNSSAGSAGRP